MTSLPPAQTWFTMTAVHKVGYLRTKRKTYPRLLRPYRQRPSCRSAAEKNDELAPPDVICHPILPAQAVKRRTIACLDLTVCDLLHPLQALTAASGAGIFCNCSRRLMAQTRDAVHCKIASGFRGTAVVYCS